MSMGNKKLRCRLRFHHWHYECRAEFPHLYAEAMCFYCGKEDLITGLTAKEWFTFSEASTWDKHNPALRQYLV